MSFAFGTNWVCVFLYGLYAVHFVFTGRKHSCISVLHGSKAKGSEVRRQIGDKWCPLLASVLHFKADVLLSLMSKTVQGLFFSNGKIWGILVLYRSRCVAKTQNIWWPNIGSRSWCPSVLQVLPSGLRVTQRNLCDICSVMNFVILVHSCLHLQFPCVFATTSQ